MAERYEFSVPKRTVGIVVVVLFVLAGLYGVYRFGISTTAQSAAVDLVEIAALNTTTAAMQADLEAMVATATALVSRPTATPQPVQALLPTNTPVPTVDPDEVFTGSLPNFCDVLDTTQEDIDGEMLAHGNEIYQNSAIGLADCATAFEGRWYEGFPPSEDHHVTGFFSSAENVSVYQGSQWIMPVGTEPRDILFGLAVGKCENWLSAPVEPEPLVFDYVDTSTMNIVHEDDFTCQDIAEWEFEEENGVKSLVNFQALENPLPEEIGLIPGEALPHFSLGYSWGGVAGSPVTTGAAFSGESRFDSENQGMLCRSIENPLMGDNVITLDPEWDPQCIYLVDASKSKGGDFGREWYRPGSR